MFSLDFCLISRNGKARKKQGGKKLGRQVERRKEEKTSKARWEKRAKRNHFGMSYQVSYKDVEGSAFTRTTLQQCYRLCILYTRERDTQRVAKALQREMRS